MPVLSRSVYETLQKEGLIAIVRGIKENDVLKIAEYLLAGGVKMMEVAIKDPGDFKTVSALIEAFGKEMMIGTGTITSTSLLHQSIDAGSHFLLAPNLDLRVLEEAKKMDVFMIPGAFTPTEILQAQQAGATVIKFFPAEEQMAFFRNLRGPVGTSHLMPVGGIDLKNVPAFQNEGARYFGVGSSLIPSNVEWSANNLQALKIKSEQYVALIKSLLV